MLHPIAPTKLVNTNLYRLPILVTIQSIHPLAKHYQQS
jgi:hypothetical protein